MCIEDIRLGRMTGCHTSERTVTTTRALLVPAAPSRVALHIQAPVTETLVLSVEPGDAATVGFRVRPADGPYRMNVQHDFNLVTSAWYASVLANSESIGIHEAFLAKE